MKDIKIGKKTIGASKPVFVIAELSANHGHSLKTAVKTIKAIKQSGADAVKIQTYTPDTITIDSDNKYFRIKQGTVWDGRNLYGLYKEAFTPWEWHKDLKNAAADEGLVFFSSPFDKTAVDFLEGLDVPAYKIASFEITDIPLIEYAASKHKPMIISTGIAHLEEIYAAIKACKKQGNDRVILLKCTSAYPASPEEMNLLTISDMSKKFKTIIGLSDHTLGSTSTIASVALGAKIIEKHFILDRSIGGPDASFSLEPSEFKRMVESIRETEKTLGAVTYDLSRKSLRSREFCRSLFVVEDIKKGERFTEKNVRSIRPGFGILPVNLPKVLGKKAKRDILRGTPLKFSDLEK